MDDQDQDEITTLLNDCLKREAKMSTWQINFVKSVKLQQEKFGRISDKQMDVLISIWDKITAQ